MKRVRFVTLILLLITATPFFVSTAAAHPLGNFTINHYAGLDVQPEAIVIDYLLDMAEIPTFQEIAALDANGNGRADPEETAPYHVAQCHRLQTELVLRLNGRPEPLMGESSALEFLPGAGGLPTLRLNCTFQVPLALDGSQTYVEFNNNAYAERLGWREIVVTGDGVLLQGELAAYSQSSSRRLSAYPDDLLANPLDQREVKFSLGSTAKANQHPASASNPADSSPLLFSPNSGLSHETGVLGFDRNDGFTRLITLEQLGPVSLLLAIAIAFGWGAAHALTPGHGKTIVAAYLVGSRGTSRHALFLGLTTTITHTLGVFGLGFLTLLASRFIVPDQLYPWLGVVSGLMVVGLGLSLFRGRWRQLLGQPSHHPHDHHHPHQPHDRDHGHDHDHHHHHHDHDHDHSHLPPGADGSPVTWRSLLALGISGGLAPCPSALVVMLSAIALGRIGFGLVLIVAFSLGLASVLTAIGLLWVHSGRLMGRLPLAAGLLPRVAPALSALFIVGAGLVITWQALVQTGVVPAAIATITLVFNNG